MENFRPDARYASIVEHYRGLIDRGELRPGERLPTNEELTARWKMHHTTVRKALYYLETEGYIRIIPRYGTFVGLGSPARLWQKLEDALNELARAGQDPHPALTDDAPSIAGVDGAVKRTGKSWVRTEGG